ncbi:MAG: helix-turn-helix transcriptional regulator [Ilumatobacteraceae bacterium]
MLSGEILRTLRQRTGRTQADVAAEVGIPVTVLSAYERGRRQPGFTTAGHIIEALGYRVEFVRDLDPALQERKLRDALSLAEQLPYRPRPLTKVRR